MTEGATPGARCRLWGWRDARPQADGVVLASTPTGCL